MHKIWSSTDTLSFRLDFTFIFNVMFLSTDTALAGRKSRSSTLPLTLWEEEILVPSGWGMRVSADATLPGRRRDTSLLLPMWPPLTLRRWPQYPWAVTKVLTLHQASSNPTQQRGEGYLITSYSWTTWNPASHIISTDNVREGVPLTPSRDEIPALCLGFSATSLVGGLRCPLTPMSVEISALH